jgi:Peptidase family S41/N-terminal domain of Peptidase_S41 in eukaryotic IRBP
MQGKRKIRIAVATAVGVASLLAAGAGVFAMNGGRQGPPQPDMVIDKATRTEVVAAVIDNVTRHYVYPEQAAKMSDRLRAQLQHGDFDAITSADRFADALTESLRHDTHDRHLEVRYSAEAIAMPMPDDEDSPADAAAFLAERKRFNFGFETVGRLPCDIGYIDLHEFGRPEQVKSRIEAAMTLLADTRGLIIDLRRMHGGDPDTVMLFASYLYDKRTHLNDIWYRDGDKLEERWTTDTVPGIRYGQSRPIYLLTSEDTFSAGEDFAYALKNNGRAVLVGETTGGGAHPGNRHRLSAHFEMNVPDGRTISPVTKTDWEGVGVAPDRPVAAKKALDVAQVALLKKMLAVETEPEWQRKTRDRIGELD